MQEFENTHGVQEGRQVSEDLGGAASCPDQPFPCFLGPGRGEPARGPVSPGAAE